MTTSSSSCSKAILYGLLGSMAVNLFLFGFLAAKLPFHHHPHPHGPGKHAEREFRQGGRHGGPMGQILPPGMFSPRELKAEKPVLDAHFKKMRELRKEFADLLKADSLSREQIQAHFAKTDAEMLQLKDYLQTKMVDKIAAMSAEERAKFAERLKREPRHHGKKIKKNPPVAEEAPAPKVPDPDAPAPDADEPKAPVEESAEE